MATIEGSVLTSALHEDGVFHYDRGLKLTQPDLAIDFQRRQARGFISHAHSDHMGRHELALCTPETAKLYWHRLGGKRAVLHLPYRQPREFGGLQLTTYPAGHCLGSAMLLISIANCLEPKSVRFWFAQHEYSRAGRKKIAMYAEADSTTQPSK